MQETSIESETHIPTAEVDPSVATSSAADLGIIQSPSCLTSRNIIFSQVFLLSPTNIHSILSFQHYWNKQFPWLWCTASLDALCLVQFDSIPSLSYHPSVIGRMLLVPLMAY